MGELKGIRGRACIWKKLWRVSIALVAIVEILAQASSARAASTGYAADVIADGPIALWRLNESAGGAAVSQPNTHNGTYQGAIGFSEFAATGDNGVRFPGNPGTRIVVPADSALNPSSLTIEALIVWDGPTPDRHMQRILEKGISASGLIAQYGLMVTSAGKLRFELELSTGSKADESQSIVPLGRPVHVAATFDGATGQRRLYIDGQVETPATALTGTLGSYSTDLAIGNRIVNSPENERTFNGIIDEVAIFSRALAPAELTARLATQTDLIRTITLKVSPPGETLQTASFPVQFGVPFPEGHLFDPKRVRILTATDQPVLSQRKALGWWQKFSHNEPNPPPKSIKWLRVSFDAVPTATHYKLQYGPVFNDSADEEGMWYGTDTSGGTHDVQALNSPTTAGSNLKIEVNKANPRLLEQVWIPLGGVLTGILATPIDPGNQGLYFETFDGNVFRANRDPNAQLIVEDWGNHQMTLRSAGVFRDSNNQARNQWITRIKVYADRPMVRIYTTIIFSDEMTTGAQRYKDIGFELPLAPDGERTVRFAHQNAIAPSDAVLKEGGIPIEQVYGEVPEERHTFTPSDYTQKLLLRQGNHKSFTVHKDGAPLTYPAAQSARSGHWFDVTGATWGVTASLRSAWQNYPSAFEWDASGKIKVHLWTSEPGGLPLDFRADGYLDMKPGRRAKFETDLGVAHVGNWEWPSSMTILTSPAPNGAGTMYATGKGVAKTWETILEFRPKPVPATTVETPYLLQRPLLVQAEPAWLRSTLAMGRLHPKDPTTFPDIDGAPSTCPFGRRVINGVCQNVLDVHLERFAIDSAVDGDPSAPGATASPYGDIFGAFEYGEMLHNGKHAHRFFATNRYFGPSTWWTWYARTGDRRVFEFAEANSRHVMDVDTTHVQIDRPRIVGIDGSGPTTTVSVPPGSQCMADCGIIQWMNPQSLVGSPVDYAAYLTSYYYQTGYERANDVAEEIKQRILLEVPPTGSPLPGGPPKGRNIGGALSAVTSLYEASGNATLRTIAERLARELLDEDVNSGLFLGEVLKNSIPQPQQGLNAATNGPHVMYLVPGAIAYFRLDDVTSQGGEMDEWLEKHATYIQSTNDHQFQGMDQNLWLLPAYEYERTKNPQVLGAAAWNFDRMKAGGRSHVAKSVDSRIWWLNGIGYLMDGLAATNVVRTPPPESTAGEIQLLAVNETLDFSVRLVAEEGGQPAFGLGRVQHPALPGQATSWEDTDWINSKLVVYDQSGAIVSVGGQPLVRNHPLLARTADLASQAGTPYTTRAVTWFSSWGWVESFSIPNANGVYRVRVETRGRPIFRMHLLSNSSGKAMLSGASGDGMSPGDRYPREGSRWFHVPSGVTSVDITYDRDRTQGSTAFHHFWVRVTKPNGAVVSNPDLRNIGAPPIIADASPFGALGVHPGKCQETFPASHLCQRKQSLSIPITEQWDQFWAFDLGPAYPRGGAYFLDLSSPLEKRWLYFSKIPRFSGASSASAFVPSAVWKPRDLASKPDASPTFDGQPNATLEWKAVAGADDYRITVRNGSCTVVDQVFSRELARGAGATACDDPTDCVSGTCDGGVCTEEDLACAYGAGTCKRRIALRAGSGQWWIQPLADGVPADPDAWSAEGALNVGTLGEIPGTPSAQLAPDGRLQFTWQVAENARAYMIDVDDPAPGHKFFHYVLTCNGGTCACQGEGGCSCNGNQCTGTLTEQATAQILAVAGTAKWWITPNCSANHWTDMQCSSIPSMTAVTCP
jgi:hypothetical protein